MTVESQSSNGTGGIGAELSLVAGAGTTRAGYITFYRGTSQRGQIGSGTLAGGIWFGSGNAASGLHSFAAGNSNTATNDYSIALGNLNNSTATASIALGGQNGIGGSADYAIALGLANSAQATASLAAGAGNITNSGYSVALGYVNTTNAIGSLAHGMYATTTSYCESAHGGGNAPGTPQNSRVQVSGVTTATASTNVDLKAGASADQEIITRTGRIYAVEVMFVATSNAFGTVGHIVRKNALIKNSGGTVTVIDQGMEELSDTTPVDWTITLSGSGAYLRVNFAKTAGAVALRCSAKVTLVDVAAP
jgi:hypothetical protein